MLCKIFYTLMCLLSTVFIYAQTMSVVAFEQDITDNTANTPGTIVYDQNGDKCALIKIETPEVGFSFDVGLLGIVKAEQRVGEIWLYVPIIRLRTWQPQKDPEFGLYGPEHFK